MASRYEQSTVEDYYSDDSASYLHTKDHPITSPSVQKAPQSYQRKLDQERGSGYSTHTAATSSSRDSSGRVAAHGDLPNRPPPPQSQRTDYDDQIPNSSDDAFSTGGCEYYSDGETPHHDPYGVTVKSPKALIRP